MNRKQALREDDESSKEMRKMIAFIAQEASEKAREIEIKADEEFNIEKAKIVRKETAVIEDSFAKRIKHASIKRKITLSNMINSSRVKVLKALDASYESILLEAGLQLELRSREIYKELLAGLLCEVHLKYKQLLRQSPWWADKALTG